jgi:hypothetical protein
MRGTKEGGAVGQRSRMSLERAAEDLDAIALPGWDSAVGQDAVAEAAHQVGMPAREPLNELQRRRAACSLGQAHVCGFDLRRLLAERFNRLSRRGINSAHHRW